MSVQKNATLEWLAIVQLGSVCASVCSYIFVNSGATLQLGLVHMSSKYQQLFYNYGHFHI